MTLNRSIINILNKVLGLVNLKLDSLTAQHKDNLRLTKIEEAGFLNEPVFPLPDSFDENVYQNILDYLPDFQKRFDSFRDADSNDVGFAYGNNYFEACDAEVLYTLMRTKKPSRITEIGCGNSTLVIRQALLDGDWTCQHLAIDPCPRVDIAKLADEIRDDFIEFINPEEIATSLQSGDFLFIDTTHEVRPGNDVAFIFGQLLPRLKPGVIVHIHDIFLPYDYPPEFVYNEGAKWGEQYIVQAMIANNPSWRIVWPGYFMQKNTPNFAKYFPRAGKALAQSFWIEKLT